MKRTIAALIGSFLLTACFPAKELTEQNAESLLSAVSRVNQVSNLTYEGFKTTEITNNTLQKMLIRTTATISGECANNQGSYLFSKSDTSNTFSTAFDACEGDDGGLLDGTINGQFTESEDGETLSVILTGDLSAANGNESITFNPVELILELNMVDDRYSAYVSHSGIYDYDTSVYKGKVTVETVEPVGVDFATLDVSGEVTYTDSSGNVLTVEHTNNGVHLSFNTVHFKTLSLFEWGQSYQ